MTFRNKKSLSLIKLLDYAKSTNIYYWYNTYSKLITESPEAINLYKLDKLKLLLKHAVDTTPYYQRIFSENNIKLENISSFEDLKAIPILERRNIHTNQDELISRTFNKDELVKGRSSGTTGIPIDYYTDKVGMSAGVASGYILWEMSGWSLGQRNVHIWGNKSSIKRWNTLGSRVKNIIINQKNISSILLDNPHNINKIVNKIISFQPISIEGYPSAIYTLANYFKKNNLQIKSLKQVITTAENLECHQKSLIEEALAPVGDLYGSGEVLGIATRPTGMDKYYIFDPHVLVETLDSGIPGMKEILLTDLDNYAMPLIRYKIGDLIDELHQPTDVDKYPFSWFTKVHGRCSDIITLPNGMKLHPINIFGGTLFRRFPNILKHKVVWDGSALKFVFEAPGFSEKAKLYAALTELLTPYQVKFGIDYTDKIEPSKSGKHTYFEIDEKITK